MPIQRVSNCAPSLGNVGTSPPVPGFMYDTLPDSVTVYWIWNTGLRSTTELAHTSSFVCGGRHHASDPRRGAPANRFPAAASRTATSADVTIAHSFGFDTACQVISVPLDLPLYVTLRNCQSNSVELKNERRLKIARSFVTLSRSPSNAPGLFWASQELACTSAWSRQLLASAVEEYAHWRMP